MDFVFDNTEATNCARCGGLVDVANVTAFKVVACPHCKAQVRVPGKLANLILLEEIGSGAAGLVYKALDTTLNRHVAVKLLKNDGNEDSKKIVEATVAEARALAAMNHPNVVHIHTIGMRHGQPYIVMELLMGSGKLNVMLTEGWTADEKRGLEIGIDVAQGLRAAQAAGLLHRDVKPGNILFNSEGVAKLLDFSVVHAASTGGEKVVIGTPYYISPESARAQDVDFRTDLYSLGATLYHLMTGKPVFDGESSRDVLRARLKQRAPDIRVLKPQITAATAGILAKMLETQAADRHESYDELISEMKAALDAFLRGDVGPAVSDELSQLHDALSGAEVTPAVPLAMPRRSRGAAVVPARKEGMSPAMMGLISAAALVVIVGIIVVMAMSGGSGDKPAEQKDAGDDLAVNTDEPKRKAPEFPRSTDGGSIDKSGLTGSGTSSTKTPPVTPPKVEPPVEPEPEPEPPKPEPEPVKPPQTPVVPPQPPVPQPPAVDPIEAAYKAWIPKVTAQLRSKPTQWATMTPRGLGSLNGAILQPQQDGSVLVTGKNEAIDVLGIEATTMPVKLSQITAVRLEVLPDDSLPSRGPGRSATGNFVLTHVTFMVRPTSDPATPPTQANSYLFENADAEFAQDQFPIGHAIDGNPVQTGWAIAPRLGQAVAAIFPVRSVPAGADEQGMVLKIMLHHQSQHGHHTIGKFRVSVTTDKDPFLAPSVPDNIKWILTATNGRTPEQEAELKAYYRRVKVEGMEYIPPGGVATNPPNTPNTGTNPNAPKPTGPAPPKLDPYAAVEFAKLPVNKNYDAEPDDLVLIPRFAQWHYFAEPKSPPANWQTADFYATGWKLGEAAIGYGFNDLRTDLKASMKGNFSAVYLRAPFTVADANKIQELSLQGRFDDAVIIYLNGQEVYRSPGTVGSGDSAKVTLGAPRAAIVSLELKDVKKHLKTGVNTIAIEAHNITPEDVDFVIDPALVAKPVPVPRVALPNNTKDGWTASAGKLFADGGGVIVDGEEGAPRFATGACKTDFDDRSSNIRVFVKLRVETSGVIKLEAAGRPKGSTKDSVDDTTLTVATSRTTREVMFKVKVAGKLNGLTFHLPKGETVIESIRVVQERDSKVSDSWDFKK